VIWNGKDGTDIFFQNEMAGTPDSQLRDLVTVFLSTAGSGGIAHVVNDTGSSSTAANPDAAVDVVSYP
jgi:hypothetical protein